MPSTGKSAPSERMQAQSIIPQTNGFKRKVPFYWQHYGIALAHQQTCNRQTPWLCNGIQASKQSPFPTTYEAVLNHASLNCGWATDPSACSHSRCSYYHHYLLYTCMESLQTVKISRQHASGKAQKNVTLDKFEQHIAFSKNVLTTITVAN